MKENEYRIFTNSAVATVVDYVDEHDDFDVPSENRSA
jgi:hypothetical protein